MNTLKALFLFTIFILSGCANIVANGPVYSEAPKPSKTETKAIVYIYRTDGLPGAGARRDISINDQFLLTLNDGGFSWFTIEPGQVEIKADIPWSQRAIGQPYTPLTTTINVEKNQTYYVHLNIGVELMDEPLTGIEMVGSTPVFTSSNIRAYHEKIYQSDSTKALQSLPNYKYESPKWQ